MEVWKQADNRISHSVLLDVDFGREDYPKHVEANNRSVLRIVHAVPGIFEITCTDPQLKPMVITGGIHGDEKAGVSILDDILQGIINGDIPVWRNLLLMYGNLQAMKVNDFAGARCIESEVGVTANLNRCFGMGLFSAPQCYAERRANQMTTAARSFVATHGIPEVIDIHQSFAVPSLEEVRGGAPDRSDYTYVMCYPIDDDVEKTLVWLHRSYSDIVAGAVINDMSVQHHTFAGYMAAEFGANAATFEQGTIGYVDFDTFVPQLRNNLIRKIGGGNDIDNPEGFDVWRYVRAFENTSSNFRFVDAEQRPCEAPRDFLPIRTGVVAIDGAVPCELHDGECLLFANPHVPVGDRAAAVVRRISTDVVPKP